MRQFGSMVMCYGRLPGFARHSFVTLCLCRRGGSDVIAHLLQIKTCAVRVFFVCDSDSLCLCDCVCVCERDFLIFTNLTDVEFSVVTHHYLKCKWVILNSTRQVSSEIHKLSVGN